MTSELTLLLALIAVAAAWLLVHLVLLVRALRSRALPAGLRWLALVPLATPFVGWALGARALCALWLALAVAYGALRVWASTAV